VDSGQYNKTPLLDTQNYCYAVMTQGAYANAPARAPLRNFSEIICSVPQNNAPPCAPTLALNGIDCSTYTNCPSIGQTYSNTIKWHKLLTSRNCNPAIIGYNIYASPAGDQPFTLIAQGVTDTSYMQPNLPSLAMCYKVSALDQQGKESPLSDQFCFDNCPNYVLPNVFTPNDDKCNAVFSAYSLRDLGSNGSTPCAQLDSGQLSVWRMNCARFVNAVTFNVYNRWGKEVYSYQSDETNSIYIDWNGKDNAGKDLDEGTYYYVANVVFDVLDPKKQNTTLHGWVVILR